jgi:hypothetical protein
MSEPWSIDIDGIRRWRDDQRDELGSHGLASSSSIRTPRGEWYAIDLLLRELDRVGLAIGQMWKDHQCQRPDLEAIVRGLAESDPFRCDMYDDPTCTFCRQYVGRDHQDDCEWRRAVEWVRDQEAE